MNKSERLGYLDSAHGIAACVVLLHHCYLTSQRTTSYVHFTNAFHSLDNFLSYLTIKLLAAHAAVIFFFVLSGFVLALSLTKHPISYFDFAIRRFFRIYPAFFIAVVLSYICHILLGAKHGLPSDWFERFVVDPDLSLTTLIRHLIMWGTVESKNLDNVVWSLTHEMRISLLFPLILFSVQRYGWRAVAVYGFVSLTCTLWALKTDGIVLTGFKESTFVHSLAATIYFIVFFAAGAVLALNRIKIRAKIEKLHPLTKFLTLLLFIFFILTPIADDNTILCNVVDYIAGLGALGIICMALGFHEFAAILNHKIPAWLGRISYSLYLVHIPIIYVMSQIVDMSAWSFFYVTLVVSIMSLITAELMVRYIEVPGIQLGKIFTPPRKIRT